MTSQAKRFLCGLFALWGVALLLFLPGFFVARGAQNSGPQRDAWQHPEEVMDALRLHRGSIVADVGCGAGYFVFHLADRVGPQGRVYAEDILQFRLDEIRQEADKEGLKQITIVLGTPDNPKLPDSSLDSVLAVNTFHEWRQFDAMLRQIYKTLKPGGLFGLIDRAAQPNYPRSYYYARHRMPQQMERADSEHAGFRFLRQEPGFTRPDDGSKFYLLILQKPQ
jgi:predicted methyltransferase